MALIKILKDKLGRVLYPRTVTGAVYDADGVDLETRLAAQRTARSEALAGKVSAAQGRGLSTNDYTNEAKAKLDALPTAANLSMQLGQAERADFNTRWVARGYIDGQHYSAYDPENAPDPAKPYMLNELWFSYDEAVVVLESSHPMYCSTPLSYAHTYPKCKTVFPSVAFGNSSYNFGNCNRLVNIRLCDGYGYSYVGGSLAISNCSNLRRVLTPFAPNGSMTSDIYCLKLEEFKLHLSNNNCKAVNLKFLSLWSLESAQYTAANKTSTVAVVITVHADVFAKLTGDTSNAAAAALTEEELASWGAVLEAASAKNITFATA